MKTLEVKQEFNKVIEKALSLDLNKVTDEVIEFCIKNKIKTYEDLQKNKSYNKAIKDVPNFFEWSTFFITNRKSEMLHIIFNNELKLKIRLDK